MDIKNYIRVEALVDLSQFDAASRHLDRYTAAIDRHNLALRRLQSGPAERALQNVARAATSASTMTQAAMTRLQTALRTGLGRLSGIAGPAQAGFAAIASAAEGAARRAGAAFQRLRIALPRIGLEGLTRPLLAAIPVVQRAFATIATAARSAFTSASATVVRFAGTVQGSMARVATSLGVSGSFTGGLDRLRRNILAANSDLKRMAEGGTVATRAFTGLFERVNQASTGFVNAADTMRALGAEEYSAVAATAALELGLQGLKGSLGAIGAGASSIFSGLKAGLTGKSVSGPATGNAVAAAGGWKLVERAAATAGATMRAAGLTGIAALRGIAATAATTGAAIHAAFLGASVALGAVGAISTLMGARFEQAMNKVFALTTVAPDQFKALSAQVVELSRTVPRSATELANGLYYVVSAGIAVKDAFDVLAVSAKAAVAGQTSVEVVANAVTSAMLAYSSAANQAAGLTLTAADAANIITKAVVEGKTEFDTFANSIGRVLPLASQLGVSFEEVAAAIATVTRIGLSSDEAATALRGIFNEIVQAAKPGGAKDALASVGLSSASLQKSLSEQGLLSTLKLVYDAFGGNIDQIELFIPNIRALTGFLALANSQADAYAEVLFSIQHANEGAGAAQEAFTKAMKTLVNQLALVRNLFGAIGIAIFNVLQPALVAITQTVAAFLNRIIDWINLNPKLFESIVKVSAALTALTLVSLGLPKLLQTLSVFFVLFGGATVRSRGALAGIGIVLGKLLPVLVLASVAVFGLSKAFDVHLGTGIQHARNAFQRLLGSASDVLGGVRDLFTGIVNIIKNPLPRVGGFQEGLTDSVVTPLAAIKTFVAGWQKDQRGHWWAFRSDLRGVFGGISSTFKSLGDQLRGPLATIGSIFSALAPQVLPAIGHFLDKAVDAGGQFVVKLVNGFIKAAPKIVEGMNTVKSAVVDWVLETVPVLAARLGRWAVEVGPLLLDAFGKIIAGLATWLIEQGPRIAGALGSWAVTAVGAIAAAAGAAIDELLKVLQETRIVEAIASWIPQVVSWILTKFIPAVVLAVAYLIPKLAAVMFEAGVQAVDGLVRGISKLEGPIQVVVGVITALLIPALLAWIYQMGRAAIVTGINLVGSLAQLVVQILAASAALTVHLLVGLAGVVGMAARLAFALGAEGIGGLLAGLVGKMAGLAGALGGVGAAGDVAAVGLGGAGVAAGGLVAILSGVGIAVALFAAAYATNFLGIRDITDTVVAEIGDKLTDFLRWLGLIDRWAKEHANTRTGIDTLGESIKGLGDAVDSAREHTKQPLFNPATGEIHLWKDSIDSLLDSVTRLGGQYGLTADEAVQAFTKLVQAEPDASDQQWIIDFERQLKGLPTSIDLAITRLNALRQAAGNGFQPTTFGFEDTAPSSHAFDTFVQTQKDTFDESITSWVDYKQKVSQQADEVSRSILGLTDPLESALSTAQRIFGERLKLPELDISGLTQTGTIDALKTFLAKIPAATDDMTVQQRLSLENLRTETQRQLDILVNGLDQIALDYGANTDYVYLIWKQFAANPTGGIDPTAATIAFLAQHGYPPDIPPIVFPVPDFSNLVTPKGSSFANKVKIGQQAILEAFGLDQPIQVPAPVFALSSAESIVGNTGTNIVTTIQNQMTNAAGTAADGARTVASAISGILRIASEPSDPSSPLVGITLWGANIVRTIAVSLIAGRGLLRQAATIASSGVTLAFVLLAAGAVSWGLRTGFAFATGLRASRSAITTAAYYAVAGARRVLEAFSPPGPDSPLHDIMDWGRASMEAFAVGMESAQDRIKQAAINAVSAAGPVLQNQLAVGGIGISGGPQQATMWAHPDASNGRAFSASGDGTLVPGLMADLVHEQRLHSQLLARIASRDPHAGGPPAARGELDKLRWLRGQHR